MKNDLEYKILGTALTYQNAALTMTELLPHADVFINEVAQGYFRAVSETLESREGYDMTIVMNRAKKHLKSISQNEVMAFGIELMSKAEAPSIQSALCHELLQEYVRRKVNEYGYRVSAYAKDPALSPEDLIIKAGKEISDIENLVGGANEYLISDQVAETINQLRAAVEKKGLIGKETGLTKLDQKTGGWQKGHLITIAGRPAMGKSALALKTIVHSCQRGIPCLLFSREMTAEEVIKRAHCIMGGSFNMDDLFTKGLRDKAQVDHFELESAAIRDWNLVIDEHSGNLTQMIFAIKRFHKQYPDGLVVLDYLQLMDGWTDKKYSGDTQKLTDITRALKATAKGLGIPIIQLSQLNRDVENRPNKIPQLSDLKQSGSIEEDSNMVIFCYRPEYYRIECFPDGEEAEGLCDLLVAKNRGGKTGRVRVEYKGIRVLFQDREMDLPKPKQPVSNELTDFSEPSHQRGEDDLPY